MIIKTSDITKWKLFSVIVILLLLCQSSLARLMEKIVICK